ncbi:uncharacterized protein CANTADRAFT_271648 [Suhomyces tanzawaensis NRRL Y-17324]|uniref:Uncharacterized protein n=1 Tax=Suhomyces tanzawaensis NRRL Y-17324 TaxID=984487 RepID=A0A1E4SGL9_9ASCO|nr:uncharacterized protein CANTADRAFT_271648 [Suhomyces tanzawaensis NRRL Y-17324]ODV78654.1 hypothetical protein CANTADRAFT_271648 [Suhomyces tanzawaensis NRRL Y-17324]
MLDNKIASNFPQAPAIARRLHQGANPGRSSQRCRRCWRRGAAGRLEIMAKATSTVPNPHRTPESPTKPHSSPLETAVDAWCHASTAYSGSGRGPLHHGAVLGKPQPGVQLGLEECGGWWGVRNMATEDRMGER